MKVRVRVSGDRIRRRMRKGGVKGLVPVREGHLKGKT